MWLGWEGSIEYVLGNPERTAVAVDKLNFSVKTTQSHPQVAVRMATCKVGPWFIVSKTPEEAGLIRAACKVNDGQPQWVLEKDHQAVGQFLSVNPDKNAKNLTIGCFGLAYKPDVDDLRENPALKIASAISEQHASEVWAWSLT